MVLVILMCGQAMQQLLILQKTVVGHLRLYRQLFQAIMLSIYITLLMKHYVSVILMKKIQAL